jgi:hypothetical protein
MRIDDRGDRGRAFEMVLDSRRLLERLARRLYCSCRLETTAPVCASMM